MNRATEIALEFMVGQITDTWMNDKDGSLIWESWWDVEHVKNYYQDNIEDYPEQYDEDHFSIWFVDKRTPCIDWSAVADAVQDDRDGLYILSLFE